MHAAHAPCVLLAFGLDREVASASATMVIALTIAMLSLRSVSGGIIAVQLASSALLCPVLPVLLVCEMSPQIPMSASFCWWILS